MLVISSGHCIEACEDGTWSAPDHELLSGHLKLDLEMLAPVENHSAQAAVVFKSIGYTAMSK